MEIFVSKFKLQSLIILSWHLYAVWVTFVITCYTIQEILWSFITHYDICSCVICIFDEDEYLDKEETFKKFYQRIYIVILIDKI